MKWSVMTSLSPLPNSMVRWSMWTNSQHKLLLWVANLLSLVWLWTLNTVHNSEQVPLHHPTHSVNKIGPPIDLAFFLTLGGPCHHASLQSLWPIFFLTILIVESFYPYYGYLSFDITLPFSVLSYSFGRWIVSYPMNQDSTILLIPHFFSLYKVITPHRISSESLAWT